MTARQRTILRVLVAVTCFTWGLLCGYVLRHERGWDVLLDLNGRTYECPVHSGEVGQCEPWQGDGR